MSIPIATELMKKHTTFIATFSLIISARTPLIIRVIHPAARAYTASVKMLFVASATTDEIIKNDEYFHQLIVNYSDNKTLTQLLSQVQELALRFRYIYYDDFSRYERMPKEHEEIEEAILSGDIEKAKIVAEEHVAHLKEFVIKHGENLFQDAKKDEAN